MPKNSAMNLLPQEKTVQTSTSSDNTFFNIVIWVLGIFVSSIPLFVTPLVKLGIYESYNNWFNDIFNNGEILIISVCLAVPAIFNALTKEQKKLSFILGVLLFIFTLFCLFVYCTTDGVTTFAKITKDEIQPMYQLGKINGIILIIMFLLGLLSFFTFKQEK